MIDAKKVRLMAKIASYEKDYGRGDMKIHRFNKKKYLQIKQLQALICVTVAYMLLVGLLFIRFYTEIMADGMTLQYKYPILLMAAGYIAAILLEYHFSKKIYTKRYQDMEKHVKEYDHNLFRLRKYIEKTEELS